MLLRLTTALIGGLTACSVLAADFQPVDSIKAAALGAMPAGAEAEATLHLFAQMAAADAAQGTGADVQQTLVQPDRPAFDLRHHGLQFGGGIGHGGDALGQGGVELAAGIRPALALEPGRQVVRHRIATHEQAPAAVDVGGIRQVLSAQGQQPEATRLGRRIGAPAESARTGGGVSG